VSRRAHAVAKEFSRRGPPWPIAVVVVPMFCRGSLQHADDGRSSPHVDAGRPGYEL